MSLQSSYKSKSDLYDFIDTNVSIVKHGKPRQLIFKHFNKTILKFVSMKEKKEWVERQESTLKQLERVLRRLSSKIYISKAA